MGELAGLRGITLVGSGPFALDYCCDWSGLEGLALIFLTGNGLAGPAPWPRPAPVGFYDLGDYYDTWHLLDSRHHRD